MSDDTCPTCGMDGSAIGDLRDALATERAEVERLRHGLPRPDSVRYGIEAEPWEGNGPCMDCEGRSPFWHAPNNLWDAVMGDGEHTPAPGLICPVCFTIRAWKRGIEGWDSQWNWVLPGTEFAPVTDVVDAFQERNDALEALGDLRSLLATAEGDKAAFLDVIAERTIERDAALARVADVRMAYVDAALVYDANGDAHENHEVGLNNLVDALDRLDADG